MIKWKKIVRFQLNILFLFSVYFLFALQLLRIGFWPYYSLQLCLGHHVTYNLQNMIACSQSSSTLICLDNEMGLSSLLVGIWPELVKRHIVSLLPSLLTILRFHCELLFYSCVTILGKFLASPLSTDSHST